MYDLLSGVRVLDVSILAPAMLGMNLADMGADVIKIEAPGGGDHIRIAPGRLHEGAPSFSHLRWNRGKRSVTLNLKTSRGVEIFLELAKQCHVVIEGLRAGTMARLGVGYEAVRKVNPKIVFCSISGTGQTGPYATLGMHGAGMDAFAGVARVAFRDDGRPYIGGHIAFGSRIGPLYAAFATAAALVKAERTGRGSYVDVAESDAAAFANVDPMLYYLNTGRQIPDDVYKGAVRNQAYRTADGKFILFQAFEHKFWKNFCDAIGRPDMVARGGDRAGTGGNELNLADGDDSLRDDLAAILLGRTQKDWIEFFIANNIPGGPMNSLPEMLDDPHFRARDNLCEYDHPGVGSVTMPTTPIKLNGAGFGVRPAPAAGEHTEEILQGLLGYDQAELQRLRDSAVIA